MNGERSIVRDHLFRMTTTASRPDVNTRRYKQYLIHSNKMLENDYVIGILTLSMPYGTILLFAPVATSSIIRV